MEQRGRTRVFLYARGSHAERLQRVVRDLVPPEETEVFQTIEAFSERLRKPVDPIPVVVILAASDEDLADILSVSHLLHDVRCILILPDRADATIAVGHSLRPRFLSYVDSDFKEVAAVLDRMIDKPCPGKAIALSPVTVCPVHMTTGEVGRAARRSLDERK